MGLSHGLHRKRGGAHIKRDSGIEFRVGRRNHIAGDAARKQKRLADSVNVGLCKSMRNASDAGNRNIAKRLLRYGCQIVAKHALAKTARIWRRGKRARKWLRVVVGPRRTRGRVMQA